MSDPQKKLKYWPETVRAFPNEFARSALFSAASSRRNPIRQTFKHHEMATVKGRKLYFSGEELRQDDEDVFLQLCHLARGVDMEKDPVLFRPGHMLNQLGWGRTTKNYVHLEECLIRLRNGGILLVDEFGRKLHTSFVQRWFLDPQEAPEGAEYQKKIEKGYWAAWLDPSLSGLFTRNYSFVDWDQRKRLGNNNLAKWFHSFYRTHQRPYAMKLDTLKRLSSNQAQNMWHFRESVGRSLEKLVEIGYLQDFRIDDNDLVHVRKAASELDDNIGETDSPSPLAIIPGDNA